MNSAAQGSPVCIVGVGAVTAVGLTAPSVAAAVRAGVPGFGEHPFMLDRQGEPMIVASVPSHGTDGSQPDRFSQLAGPALREALLPLQEYRRDLGSMAAYIGLPPQRPGRPADLKRLVTETLVRVGGVKPVECIATGHSGGLMALETASRALASDPVGFYVAGGVDSYLEQETLEWLEANDQLHGGPNPYGFLPGEAASFCLLCSQQTAQRLHLPVLARVWAAATTQETKLIKTDTVCLGHGLTEVFQKVLAQLPGETERIDHVICDMNGEPYRAEEYGFTVCRLTNRFTNASDFLAPADCWGDVGAASGPLFVNLVVAAGLRGYDHFGFNLLWTSSETGERSAVIIQSERLPSN